MTAVVVDLVLSSSFVSLVERQNICLASVEPYSRKTNKANISLFPLSQGMYPPASRIYPIGPGKYQLIWNGVSVDVDLSGTSWHSSAQTNFADLITLPPAVGVLRLHFLPPAMIPSMVVTGF
jgi:hypothetical protein